MKVESLIYSGHYMYIPEEPYPSDFTANVMYLLIDKKGRSYKVRYPRIHPKDMKVYYDLYHKMEKG